MEMRRRGSRGPLGQRAKQRLVVNRHLQRAVLHGRWRFRGKREQWRPIEQGPASPCTKIGRPRSKRPVAGSRTPSETPTHIRHKARGCLIADQNKFHRSSPHRLHVRHPRSAWNSKHILHTSFGKQLNQCLGDRRHDNASL